MFPIENQMDEDSDDNDEDSDDDEIEPEEVPMDVIENEEGQNEGEMPNEEEIPNEAIPNEGEGPKENPPNERVQMSDFWVPQRDSKNSNFIQFSKSGNLMTGKVRSSIEKRMMSKLSRRKEQNDPNYVKFDNLYQQLKSSDIDEIKNTITVLNTEIWMSNESMKRAIRPERFVKPLLTQLNNGVDSSLMLSASNCLLTIVDIFPEVSEKIIDVKGLKILEEKGKNFQYIDVAEDCVKLLDKIADHCPGDVWMTGCASHFLSFMDFFDKNVQKTIMNLISKVIKEFCSLSQWNDEVKSCVSQIIKKCSQFSFQEVEMLSKNLECLSTFLQRLVG